MRVAALRASPAFQQLTPQHQAALIATFEDVPRVFRAEFGRELELISQRVAPRFARVMSACELVAVADAIQAPETQPLLQEMVLRGISGEPTESAFPDLSRTDAGGAFLATPIGIHFLEVRSELDQIVAEESRSIATLGGRMGTLGMAMACDALEDECPATTRQRLGRQ
ncbi:MAG: hypothetical protein NT015_08645 [Alphaproteobacteria bacterium]|nr:hypothetical protein [Alphaproteobacteria bacterium]